MALAMLRGYKRIESRKGRRLPAGWYCLHVGQKSLRGQPPECSQALQRVWPDAPSEDALPTSCVVGMVCLGKVLQCQLVDDPWKCESLPLVHVIDATLEFLQPVLQVRGSKASGTSQTPRCESVSSRPGWMLPLFVILSSTRTLRACARLPQPPARASLSSPDPKSFRASAVRMLAWRGGRPAWPCPLPSAAHAPRGSAACRLGQEPSGASRTSPYTSWSRLAGAGPAGGRR